MENCYISQDIQEQKRVNKEINCQLMKDAQDNRQQCKLLLLGARESGKSTFIKQMRVIHGEGYSEGRKAFVKLVFENVFQGIQALCEAMKNLKIKYDNPVLNEGNAKLILEVDHEEVTVLDEVYTSAISSLWSDSGIQEAWNRRKEFQIFDSAKYYLDDLHRLAAPNYIPNEEDILRSRVQTNGGIIEYAFDLESIYNTIQYNIVYRMVDVGRQYNEWRKCIHCFENVDAVLFFLALSEFDQVNQMEESKALFKSIITSPWLNGITIYLFLNKTDLFEEKMQKSELANYFPEYTGEKGDTEAAKEFILTMFLDLNPDKDRLIYSYFTRAIDTENIRYVFAAVKETVFGDPRFCSF